METTASKMRQRICYAAGTFGHDVFYAILATYFMIFVTSNLFHSEDPEHDAYMIGIITTVIMVLRIVEVVIDPVIGNLIDKTKTRWGKFKPWIVIGSFASVISMAACYTDLGGLTANPVLYTVVFAILYLVMDIFFSAKDVAIWSMIPALSFDSHERDVTASFARIGSVFGGQLVGIIVMPVVLYFSVNANGGAGDPNGWFAFAVIGGSITIIGAIILALGTKEQSSALRENKEDTPLTKVFSVLFKNDQLLWIACTWLILGLGQNIVYSLNLYYFIYVIGAPEQFSFLGVINLVIGLLGVSFFPSLAQKFSRRRIFFAGVAIEIVALVLYAVAGKSVILSLIAAGLFNLPGAFLFLVVLMTITDSVEYGQLKSGHRDEALVLCVRPLVDKISGAIVSGMIGFVAVWVGMTSGASAATLTAENVTNLHYIMFGAPIVLIILASIIYRSKVTLDEKKHEEIVKELESKWETLKES